MKKLIVVVGLSLFMSSCACFVPTFGMCGASGTKWLFFGCPPAEVNQCVIDAQQPNGVYTPEKEQDEIYPQDDAPQSY